MPPAMLSALSAMAVLSFLDFPSLVTTTPLQARCHTCEISETPSTIVTEVVTAYVQATTLPAVTTTSAIQPSVSLSPIPKPSGDTSPVPDPANDNGLAIIHNYCPFIVYMFISCGTGGGGQAVNRPLYGNPLDPFTGVYQEQFKMVVAHDTAFHFDLEPDGPDPMQFEFSLGDYEQVYWDADVEKGDPLFDYGYSIIPSNPDCPQVHCAAGEICPTSFHNATDGHVVTCHRSHNLDVNLCRP